MTPDQVIKHFDGSRAKAADELGISTMAISKWYKARKISPRMQAYIQIKTGGALKARLDERNGR